MLSLPKCSWQLQVNFSCFFVLCIDGVLSTYVVSEFHCIILYLWNSFFYFLYIVLCYAKVLQFTDILLLMHIRLFPLWDSYEWCCYKYHLTCVLVNICSHVYSVSLCQISRQSQNIFPSLYSYWKYMRISDALHPYQHFLLLVVFW